MDLTAEAASRPPEIPTGQFFRDVFGIYHRHFWLFMRFLVPVTIFSYVAVTMAGEISQDILRRVPHNPAIVEQYMELLESFVVRLGGWLVSWIVYCFAFAGITVAIRGIESGSAPLAEESLTTIRERPMLFLRVAVALYLLLLVSVGLALGSGLILVGLWSKLNFRPLNSGGIQATLAALLFVFLLALSRFGLALPATVLDGLTVRQSLFRSDELTSGRLRILVALLLKSVAGSYIMAIAPFWIAGHVFGQHFVPVREWWVLTALSFLGVLVVEPTMFIGFALLYIRSTQPLPEPFKAAPAI